MGNSEIIISVDEQEKRVAVIENGQLEDLFLEREGHDQLAGNIYKGKVAQIAKGIEAAFVDIGLAKNGFLFVQEILPEPADQEEGPLVAADNFKNVNNSRSANGRPGIESLVSKGQEVLVQVVKEPFGTKGCRLSSQISLPGRFLVLMPYSRNIGISKRIVNEKERTRLRSLLKAIGLPKDMGCIMRTQAQGKGKREFVRELRYLLRIWRNVRLRAAKKAAPCLIHKEYDLILRTARDFFSDDTALMVLDGRDDYRRVLSLVKVLAPHLRRRLKLYKDKMNLFEKYDVDHKMKEIFSREVSLKKGGYIVIERTEAFISIDVNSGRFVSSERLEETAFITNLDAVREIARQLRLRDLAGIIIIDFIDMQKSSHRKKVLQVLEKATERDKARVGIYPFSALGVVQIARQRIRKNIESITFQNCPVCLGRGKIKSTQSIAINILRQIKQFLLSKKKRYLEIYVHPLIAMRLLNEERTAITSLEKRMWIKIAILSDEHLGIEEVRFL